MFLSAGGNNVNKQLGIQNQGYSSYIDAATRVPFDIEGIQSISGGAFHSVVVKNSRVFAAGNDTDFKIGSLNSQIYTTFTEINISDEPISWAACGDGFTLYLTVNGIVILCHKCAKGERIQVSLPKKAVSVFAGSSYGGIIDEKGAFYILEKDAPHKIPRRFSFKSPAVDIACCLSFTCVLTSDGCVYANNALNNNSFNFVEVPSLKGKKVEKLSGYYNTCAVLTSNGNVFICGENYFGQLGNGTEKDNFSTFTKIRLNEVVKDVGCSDHTIVLTKSNKIFGCGFNKFNQLLKKTSEENVRSPILVASIVADQVIVGYNHTFILSGTGKLENPAIKKFKAKIQDAEKPLSTNKIKEKPFNRIEEQNEKIDSLIAICQAQSQSINKLTETYLILQQQNEMIKQEMRENQRKQEQRIQELHDELKALKGEMNEKLDPVVKYISDQDYF